MTIKKIKSLLLLLLFVTKFFLLKAQLIQADTEKNKVSTDTTKDFPIPSLKNIAIGKFVKLTIGGQLREYYQFYNNETWSDIPPTLIDKNGFYWHRIVLSTDWQFGKKINLFGELNAALTSSRKGGNRPSIDYNELDISQLYLQITVFQNLTDSLKIRAGRQMYPFGSQRLITTREGPNNRLSFNGATAIYQNKNFTLTSFIAQPVYNKFYVFDDLVVKSQTVWGVNLQQQTGKATKWELYYYGYHNSNIKLAGNFGKDIRHSIGVFFITEKKGWTLEAEPVLQFGKFNTTTIFAYGIFCNVQKKIPTGKISITPTLSLAAFSGDKNSNNGSLNTYNPMYPKPPFGLIAPLGPVNLLVCNSGIKMSINNDWQFSVSSDLYWRESHADGLYTPAANPAILQIYSADAVNQTHAKFIGQDYVADINYRITGYLFFGFEGGYFAAGDYLKQTGKGKNITYLSGTITLNF